MRCLQRRENMQHLAIIPDGNRRWARQNKLQSLFGHRRGMDAVLSAVNVCLKNEIKYLSIYTFSLENFRRSEEERSYLFELLSDGLIQELSRLVQQGINIKFLGDTSLFPEKVQQAINQVESATQHLDNLYLSLLFCYGAQQEIAYAARTLAQKVAQGILSIEQITEEAVSRELWTAGIPNPDLIIRTGGVVRLSNFLLFQAAYSEFKFVDSFWPDMTIEKIQACIDEFKGVKRNFGW